MLKSQNFLKNYLKVAPVPLAVERSYECEILSKQVFKRPILDIGCGDGLFATQLFDEKIDVAVEPNPVEVAHATKTKAYHEILTCWGNQIPKPDRSFQTIFSNSVLEHIPELEPVVREAHRLLADDGVFYATVPTEKFDQYSVVNSVLKAFGLQKLSQSYREFFNRFWRHYHFYTIEGWKQLFARNGFEVVHYQTYCSERSCVMNDALAPFSGPSWIVKKLANRWFVSGAIRRVTAAALTPLTKLWSDRSVDLIDGGIVFFKLKKMARPPVAGL